MVWLELLGLLCNTVAEHFAQSGVSLYLGLLRESCFPCALWRQEEVWCLQLCKVEVGAVLRAVCAAC